MKCVQYNTDRAVVTLRNFNILARRPSLKKIMDRHKAPRTAALSLCRGKF